MNIDMNNLNENDINEIQMKNPHEEFFKFFFEQACPDHSDMCDCCCDEYFYEGEGYYYLRDRKYEEDIDFINWKLKQTEIKSEKTEETKKEIEKETEETKKEIENESEKNEETENESEESEETKKEYCELCDKINDDTHIACNHLLYGCNVNYNCYFCLETRNDWLCTEEGEAMLLKKKASKIICEEICELCGDSNDGVDHGVCSHAIYGCRDYCFFCMCGRSDWLCTEEGKDFIRMKQAEGYSAKQLSIKSFSGYLDSDSETESESESHSESGDIIEETEKKTEDLTEELFKYLNKPCESDPSLRNY
jgi:hypothetical protein